MLRINKRYWVFSGEDYYPKGGMADFNKAYVTEEEALAICEYILLQDTGKWADIYDTVADLNKHITRGDFN